MHRHGHRPALIVSMNHHMVTAGDTVDQKARALQRAHDTASIDDR